MNHQNNQIPGNGGGRPEIQGFGSGNGGTAFHQQFSGPCNPNIFIFQQPGEYSVNLHRHGAGPTNGQPGGFQQNRSAPHPQAQTPVSGGGNSSSVFQAPTVPGRFSQPSPIRTPGQNFTAN